MSRRRVNLAATVNFQELMLHLLSRAPIDEKLVLVNLEHHAEAIREGRIDINRQTPSKELLVRLAARHDLPLVLERLLALGADPAAKLHAKDNTDALVVSVIYGRASCAELLARAGMDVNRRYETAPAGYPLHLACTRLHADMAKTLIAAGARVDVKDDQGNTPLHLAVSQDFYSTELVKDLIAAGADPFARNYRGKRPVDLARYEEISGLLRSLVAERQMTALVEKAPDRPSRPGL